jgi:hypothetical protein
MKVRVIGTLAAAAALAVPAGAMANNLDKATGGGQVVFSADGKGAGNTIAFNAQQLTVGEEGAKGQIQYINREAGTGQAQVKQHGAVDCIRADGNVARVSGIWRGGERFWLYVVDGGEGSASAGDTVTFIQDGETDQGQCNFEAPEDETALGRGNMQVRDNDSSNAYDDGGSAGALALSTAALTQNVVSTASLKTMSWRSALRLAGMRAWRR